MISLVDKLWESEVYATTLEIIKSFTPTEEYLNNIYWIIMETKLKNYEKWKEQEKIDAQQKMQDYIYKLNELASKQKQQDEIEADELLNSI